MPKFLFCKCHGNQVMAIEHADEVVVKARHHGQDHYLHIPKDQVQGMEFVEHLEQAIASSSN